MWNSTVSSPLATSRFMTRLVPGGASAPCSSMSLLAASNQPSERNGYLSATKCPPDLLRRGIVCGRFGAGRAFGLRTLLGDRADAAEPRMAKRGSETKLPSGTRLERIETHERNPKWKNVPLRIEMSECINCDACLRHCPTQF